MRRPFDQTSWKNDENSFPIQPYSPIHYIHQVSIDTSSDHANIMSWYSRGSANDYEKDGLSFRCVHGDKSTLLLKYGLNDAKGEIPLMLNSNISLLASYGGYGTRVPPYSYLFFMVI